MAMCCCPVVHTSWNPNSSCRNSMPILCLGTGRWFVFVDAPGNLICRQTVCAALVAKSARTLEERRSGGLKEADCPPCSQVFANYSWLSSGPPINIAATELRGITIEQLSSLQLGLHQRTAWQMPRQFCFFVFAIACEQRKKPEHITSHTRRPKLGTEVGLCRRRCLQLVRSTPLGIRAAFVF